MKIPRLYSKINLFLAGKESRELFGDLGNRENDFRLTFGPHHFDIHLLKATEHHSLPLFSDLGSSSNECVAPKSSQILCDQKLASRIYTALQ